VIRSIVSRNDESASLLESSGALRLSHVKLLPLLFLMRLSILSSTALKRVDVWIKLRQSCGRGVTSCFASWPRRALSWTFHSCFESRTRLSWREKPIHNLSSCHFLGARHANVTALLLLLTFIAVLLSFSCHSTVIHTSNNNNDGEYRCCE